MIGDAVRTAAKERCDVQQLQAIYRTVDDAVSKYAHRHHFVHSEARVKSEIKRLADREVAFVLFPEKPKGASMDEVGPGTTQPPDQTRPAAPWAAARPTCACPW